MPKQEEFLTFGLAVMCAFAVGFATIAGINVFNEIQLTTDELNAEIFAFKESSTELWDALLSASASLDAKALRERRQSYVSAVSNGYSAAVETPPPKTQPEAPICNCQLDKENKCPPGPQGAKGEKGQNGEDGTDGIPGVPGLDADDVEIQRQDYGIQCFYCPAGEPGPQGPVGARGMQGRNGLAGMPGFSGRDGFPGEVGAQGATGNKGRPGRDARVKVGIPGPKGMIGELGPVGDAGKNGKDAANGEDGDQGAQGDRGIEGMSGKVGTIGEKGDIGSPGVDAAYCPCPKRSGNHYPTV
ncbi:hypothetical protein M3Y96_01014900 [Aphelenchoides besseyi]|nr:hypothetical protein M3Y96_01014900 [Aphelenchoides besseyi]